MTDLAIPCMVMRGGTSKGPLFLATDLPADARTRDQLLLSVMGSPDIRQIDGIGGGDSLTSQVLIVSRAARDNADIDYLFAQVSVVQREVDTTPNCGNMLAAVACFAIERGLVTPVDGITRVRMFNLNTRRLVEARVPTPNKRVTYEGDARIDGVPGTGAGIVLDFVDPAGACTGQLLPTRNAIDWIDGVRVSCIDFAIPVVFESGARRRRGAARDLATASTQGGYRNGPPRSQSQCPAQGGAARSAAEGRHDRIALLCAVELPRRAFDDRRALCRSGNARRWHRCSGPRCAGSP